MKVYHLNVLVIDFDGLGHEGIRSLIEDTRYPNHTPAPLVIDSECREIGEWEDSNPLNFKHSRDDEFWRLFGGMAD